MEAIRYFLNNIYSLFFAKATLDKDNQYLYIYWPDFDCGVSISGMPNKVDFSQ